jgi:hypothetical protein
VDTTNGTVVEENIYAEWMLYESDQPDVPVTDPVFMSTYRSRSDEAPVVFRPEPLQGIERIIGEKGISISVLDVEEPGDTLDIENEMGVIGAELTFDDPGLAWLTGLPDNDDAFSGAWNWLETFNGQIYWEAKTFDKFDYFQKGFLGGRWGPFALASAFSNSSAGGGITPGLPQGPTSNNRQVSPAELVNFENLPDVDIVFTNDVTKWSRCVVVETSPGSSLGSGAWPLSAKWTANVDQEGNPQGRSETDHGMGWFPGYAINVNTGERLNLFFGESTWDVKNNGNDMLWNPTSDFYNADNFTYDQAAGRHYVYVTTLPYDGCESIRTPLTNADETGINNFAQAIYFSNTDHNLKDAYKYVAWVGVPYVVDGFDISSPTNIPTDAKVSLRTNQPFGPRSGASDKPEFTFNTVEAAVQTEQTDVAADALDKVLVVPNPYYAYSTYETGQLDNRVRITNLPEKCRVSIFTLNGHLVRQYTKDSSTPYQDWDLKNHSGVGVASGMYIIHVDANIDGQELGEKIIKLFAVMRPIDLDNF